jgi:hypothetical protein
MLQLIGCISAVAFVIAYEWLKWRLDTMLVMKILNEL